MFIEFYSFNQLKLTCGYFVNEEFIDKIHKIL